MENEKEQQTEPGPGLTRLRSTGLMPPESRVAIILGLYILSQIVIFSTPSFPYNIWIINSLYVTILFLFRLERLSDQSPFTAKTFGWFLLCIFVLLCAKVVFDIGLALPRPLMTTTFFWEAMVVGPVLEEFLFRKIFFKNFSQWIFGGKFLLPAIFVSIAFTLGHPQTDLGSLAAVFSASIVYCFAYFKTNRIELAILCHVFFNAIGVWI